MPKVKSKNTYTEDSIISLNPREFTRLRPSTYLGSNEYSTQLLREIFSNCLDEHLIGHGNEIIVEVDSNKNIYSVTDNGQGFPIGVTRDDGETVLQAAFDVLNTSGKYDENGVYGGSVLGLNGIGSKLTNYLSKSLTVKSTDGNGQWEIVKFKDGIFESRKYTNAKNSDHGTIVTWQPDPQFFQNKEINISDVKKLFEDISALCPDLTIKFIQDGKEIIYHHENGINDLLDTKIKNKELLNNRFSQRIISGDNLFDICLTYTSDYSESITAYVNYGLTESGVHISTLRTLLTKTINKYAIENNYLKKNDDNFTGAELSEGLTIIFNLKANGVKYDSQTKTRIVDIDKTLITQVIQGDFEVWLKNNPKDAKIIIDRAISARKVRDAAQKAKERARNSVSNIKKNIDLPTKLVDAWSKERDKCELFILEGDSAANGIIAKRNGEFQAVFPIRGKILSCRKATVDKIYANQEINNIVKALGLEIDKATNKLIYDKNKLRYNRIILATDADPDGYAIRMLLINMFWWLCPDLVINGHLYAAIPPLYRITTNKNKYIYLIDDKDLNKYKKKHEGEKYLINRLKGLGEMDPDELSDSILKESIRNMEQLVVSDAAVVENMLDIFEGDKVDPRREYLLNHYNDVEVDTE